MPKTSRRRRRPQGTNARRHLIVAPVLVRVARTAAPDLSPRARARLLMLDWHRAHGGNVSLTARHFGFSRPTVYRWLRRFEGHRLETLEDRRPVPRRRRRPSWAVEEAEAVARLRQIYPRWGKAKLAVLLRREGIPLSVSMVGRILRSLRRRGALPEPARRISARRRSWRRPYAIRKPADYVVQRPGDLVELDTLDVRPVPDTVLKQFTARDLVSRWDVLELRSRATARLAVSLLDALAERMPFRGAGPPGGRGQ